MPNPTDECICGHAYADHDPTSNLCRFANPDPNRSCGCAGFVIPGAPLNLPQDPPLTINEDN